MYFLTAVLTCCFNTRFFTPSITNCDPVFMTRDKRLGAKEEHCTKYKFSVWLTTGKMLVWLHNTRWWSSLCLPHLLSLNRSDLRTSNFHGYHCHKFIFVFHSIKCKTNDKVFFFISTLHSFSPEPLDLVTSLNLDVPSQSLLSFLFWPSDSLHFILSASLTTFSGAFQWLHSTIQLWWCILEWS